jgi:hypothetical protein
VSLIIMAERPPSAIILAFRRPVHSVCHECGAKCIAEYIDGYETLWRCRRASCGATFYTVKGPRVLQHCVCCGAAVVIDPRRFLCHECDFTPQGFWAERRERDRLEWLEELWREQAEREGA